MCFCSARIVCGDKRTRRASMVACAKSVATRTLLNGWCGMSCTCSTQKAYDTSQEAQHNTSHDTLYTARIHTRLILYFISILSISQLPSCLLHLSKTSIYYLLSSLRFDPRTIRFSILFSTPAFAFIIPSDTVPKNATIFSVQLPSLASSTAICVGHHE